MPAQRLTSLQLHLDVRAGEVVETDVLEDVACGVYPCYFRRAGKRLRAATSVSALIADAGALDPNPMFRPREYLAGGDARHLLARLTWRAPKTLKHELKQRLPRTLVRQLSRERFWSDSRETIDRRIQKLGPFERVTATNAHMTFTPDFALRDPETLVAGVTAHVARFMADVEAKYPEHAHVMMIGGKDSQILALPPKRTPSHWHVFSAEPNFPIVRDWLTRNAIAVGRLFTDDGCNRETPAETERKLICSDLYSDPRHMRWLPTLRRIADEFGGRCFFWSGTAADALHIGRAFHARDAAADPAHFFDIHLQRVPGLVGNYHQTVKNFTGCPLLCPYETEAIWQNVYCHHGPGVIPPGEDLRPRIGEKLAGRPIHWATRNPCPQPYRYGRRVLALEVYRRHVAGLLPTSASGAHA